MPASCDSNRRVYFVYLPSINMLYIQIGYTDPNHPIVNYRYKKKQTGLQAYKSIKNRASVRSR